VEKRFFCLLIAALSGISACTKKVDNNEIIKFSYDTPTYVSVTSSDQPIYYNTFFSDPDNAISVYASGNNGSGTTVSKKTGITGFQTVSILPQVNAAGLLTMANASTGYFAGGENFRDLYRTTDGGNTWIKVYTASWYIWGLAVPDKSSVYLISASTIFKSTDGGATFSILLPQDFEHSPKHIYFYNSNIGFVLQDNGRIIKTSDGGKSWTLYTLPTTEEVGDIFFTDVNKGYAVVGGENYLFGTTDGGKTWNRLAKNNLINSGKLFFYPDGRGIIAVRGEYILYSRNYGQTANLFLNITGDNSLTNINAVNDTTLMLSTSKKIYKVTFSKN
jgi:photosystem II stability/assembly factor-like uncharacterized protein